MAFERLFKKEVYGKASTFAPKIILKELMKVYLRQNIILAFSAVVLFSVGCARKKSFIASPPTAAYTTKFERPKELSTLNIPIEIGLDNVQNRINSDLSPVLFEDNSLDDNGGDNLMLKVSKRLPISIEPKGSQFNVSVPVRIWAKAGWKLEKFGLSVAKYEDTEFDIDVNFLTKIGIDENWKIKTNTVPNGYNWVSKPVIKIGMFEIPITRIIEKIMDEQLGMVAQIVDREVGKINLKPQVETAWKSIQEPVLINEAYKAWLKISPQEIMMTPLSTKGRNVRVGIGVKAITETFLGEKPTVAMQNNVPALKLINALDEKFEVGLIAQVPFAEARNLAMKAVGNQTFEFKDGKYKIQILDMELWGQGSNLVVAATLDGSLKGKVYLKGEPYYDAPSNSIKLKDLDYDLDTKNKLAKAADWLAHGKFLKLMEPYFVIPLASQVDEAKKLISQNLANNQLNKNIRINGKLSDLKPEAVYVIEKGIQAVISAKGKMEVLVSGL